MNKFDAGAMKTPTGYVACPIPGCSSNAARHAGGRTGYCHNHYVRKLRHGDYLGGKLSPGTLRKWVDEVALGFKGDECLNWPFRPNSAGYAVMQIDKKLIQVSRYICEVFYGPAPTPGHEAAHSCGKGHEGCVNPGHLSWKTSTENEADKRIHGTVVEGERHPKAKLTVEQVLAIRASKGTETQSMLSRQYGVSRMSIRRIWNHVSWRSLA
jgi:hypothetical protein